MVKEDIYDLMKQSCDNINVKKGNYGDERKIYNYIQRVQQKCGEKISMATICCWQALERGKKWMERMVSTSISFVVSHWDLL